MGSSALNPASKRSAAGAPAASAFAGYDERSDGPELAGGALPLAVRRNKSGLRAGGQVGVRDQAYLDEVVSVVKDLRMPNVGDGMVLHVYGDFRYGQSHDAPLSFPGADGLP